MSSRSRDRRQARLAKRGQRWPEARQAKAPTGKPTEAFDNELWPDSPPSLLTTDTADPQHQTRDRHHEA